MKTGFKTALAIGTGIVLSLPAPAAEPAPAAPTNQLERVSYSVGMSIASQIKRVGFEVDPDVVGVAIKDVLSGRQPKLTEQQAQETLMAYQQEMRAKREEGRLKLAEKNRKEGDAFLAANKKLAGIAAVQCTVSGTNIAEWQYKVVADGTGESPKAGDTVAYTFRGTLINGTEFDSTAKHGGQPTHANVSHVFPRGLNEAMQKMKTGSKWQVYLPSALAFGDFGSGPNIEPGAALIYEVELVNVETPQPLTSDIIEVPSAERMKAGDTIKIHKADELKNMMTNAPASGPKH